MVKKKIENETKHDKFVRIASLRTQKVINALHILGNCANTSNYQYSEEEINKIFKKVRITTEEIKRRFMSHIEKDKKFQL